MDFLTAVAKCSSGEDATVLFEKVASDLEVQAELTTYYIMSPDNAKLAFINLRRKVGRGSKKDVDAVQKIIQSKADAKASSILSQQQTPSLFASFEDLPSERFIKHDVCKQLYVPFGFKISDDGLSRLKVENEETVEVPIISDPVFIAGTTRDNHTHERRILLLYKDVDSCWREIECTLEDIGSNNKIMALAKIGLQVNQNNAPKLVRFLSTFYDLNRKCLPNIITTQKMGWHDVGKETVFVWPDMTMGESKAANSLVFRAGNGAHNKAKAFRSVGNLTDCAIILDKVKEYPVPIFCVYHALAGLMLPDLKLHKVHGSTLDMGAPRGTGKSTCGSFYSWVVGIPGSADDEAGLNWNSTISAVEKWAGFYNSVPFAVDETKLLLARRKNFGINDLTQWAYTQHQGSGRSGLQRDRAFRAQDSWLTNCMITGEATITSMVRDNEGARARLIPVEDLPFGANDESKRLLIKDLDSSMLRHYGVLGRKFVELLMQIREERPGLISTLYEANNKRVVALATDSTGTRVGEYIAAAMTAGDLLHDYLKMPRPSTDMWVFIERVMRNVNYQADSGEIALRQLVEHLQSNPSNVVGLGAVESSRLIGAWPTKKRPWMLITRSGLQKFFDDYGHSERTVLADWLKKGYIEINGEGMDYIRRGFSYWANAAVARVRYNVGGSSRTLPGYRIKERHVRALLAQSFYEEGEEGLMPEEVVVDTKKQRVEVEADHGIPF